jgi:glycerol-3-phosphate dehydrogenase (NAD(P)+)
MPPPPPRCGALGPRSGQLAGIAATGVNAAYLPGVRCRRGLLSPISIAPSITRWPIRRAADRRTPVSGLREMTRRLAARAAGPLAMLWLCKGFEAETRDAAPDGAR